MAKLTEEELQGIHEARDHTPFRRGCPVCIAAQSRQRSHWRASHTGVFAASFAIAGPFLPGRSFDPGASGRDKGLNYRYFLACAFTVSLLPRVSGPLEGEAREETGEPPSSAGPDLAEVPGELLPVEPVLKDLPSMEELFGVAAVRFRMRSKGPEGSEEVPRPPLELGPEPSEDPPLPPPVEEPPPIKTRMLCLAVPLRSKKGKKVLGAIQSVVNRLEAFGFPVHRYHADRAQELKSKALVTWLTRVQARCGS